MAPGTGVAPGTGGCPAGGAASTVPLELAVPPTTMPTATESLVTLPWTRCARTLTGPTKPAGNGSVRKTNVVWPGVAASAIGVGSVWTIVVPDGSVAVSAIVYEPAAQIVVSLEVTPISKSSAEPEPGVTVLGTSS